MTLLNDYEPGSALLYYREGSNEGFHVKLHNGDVIMSREKWLDWFPGVFEPDCLVHQKGQVRVPKRFVVDALLMTGFRNAR